MGVSYYDALLLVHEPGVGLQEVLASIRLPYRVLASVGVPGGRIVLAFVSDSALLSRMFAANWAQAGAGQEPDATLYALARPACAYGLHRRWDGARWWSRDQKMMLVSPESVYGTAWSSSATVVEHVAVVVRESADWLPPGREGEAVAVLESEGARVSTSIMRRSSTDH